MTDSPVPAPMDSSTDSSPQNFPMDSSSDSSPQNFPMDSSSDSSPQNFPMDSSSDPTAYFSISDDLDFLNDHQKSMIQKFNLFEDINEFNGKGCPKETLLKYIDLLIQVKEKEMNKEKRKEYYRKWSEENKEKRKEYVRKWSEENKEKRKEYVRKWKEENKEKNHEYNRKWREENRKKLHNQRMARKKLRMDYYGNKCIVTGQTDLLEFAHIVSKKFQESKGLDAPITSEIIRLDVLFEKHKDNLCLMCPIAHRAWDKGWTGRRGGMERIQNKDTLPFFIAKYNEMMGAKEDNFTKYIDEHPSKEYEEYVNGLTEEEREYWMYWLS